jgi:flagellar basal-body rod modification protein FlgD
MTQINPISEVANGGPPPSQVRRDDQFGQDTFLKLLVAQLKFQDPLSPTDSSEFLSQTAMFTQLETLQRIADQQEAQASNSQLLTASTMVGRSVSYNLGQAGLPTTPTATSVVSIRGTLPKDAADATKASVSTSVFTADGKKVPLTLNFTRTTDGWSVQPMSDGKALGSAQLLRFDATGDHINDLRISVESLDTIGGTSGKWPSRGIQLDFGDTSDPTRLQLADGPATASVAEQNGNDGQSASGVVTGIHLTASGPMLLIGGREIPLASVTDVQS